MKMVCFLGVFVMFYCRTTWKTLKNEKQKGYQGGTHNEDCKRSSGYLSKLDSNKIVQHLISSPAKQTTICRLRTLEIGSFSNNKVNQHFIWNFAKQIWDWTAMYRPCVLFKTRWRFLIRLKKQVNLIKNLANVSRL